MVDSRHAADVAVGADRDERMHADATGDVDERLHVNVAAEHRVVGHEDPVTEDAIVGDVNVDHQVVVRADASDTLFLITAAMYCDCLAEHVVIADLDPGGLPLVRVHPGVHRRSPRTDERRYSLAECRVAQHASMGDQARAPADLHVGTDHAVRPDLDIVGDVGTGVDARSVRDHRGHTT